MINRQNWLEVQDFLAYLDEVKRNSHKTVGRRRTQLRHLLEWADDRSFAKANSIRPTFPTYLETARNDGQKKPLSAGTLGGICEAARAFFTWAVTAHPRRYKRIDGVWIATLMPPKVQAGIKKRAIWTLEDVLSVVQLQPSGLTEQRDQAAIAFIFLSGMRVDAFCSMPIRAVDIDRREVRQWPSLGVRTKNQKAATTYLLEIPELLDTVAAWDSLVRNELAPDVLWYAHLNRDASTFSGATYAGASRRDRLAVGMRLLCEKADVRYEPPHKLRHGHAVYALKQAQDVADLKAVSQNLTHASLTTTDSIYSVLSGKDVGDRISSLGKNGSQPDASRKFTAAQLDQLRELLAGER